MSQAIRHEFVTAIPDVLVQDTLYVSIEYATTAHLCACGCGLEVVTPLSPHDWTVSFDGVSVSLSPSIGNWSFPCQSHYWIRRGRIDWAPRWSREQVARGRDRDRVVKESYYQDPRPATEAKVSEDVGGRVTMRERLRAWLTSGRDRK